MFFVKGWVSLFDVAQAAKLHFQWVVNPARLIERDVAETDEWFHTEDSDFDDILWQICESATEVAVLLGNGEVVQASKALVRWDGISGTSNSYVDLMIGTVGSTAMRYDNEEPLTEEQRLSLFGPFLNLPILLPEVCLEMASGKRPIPAGEAARMAQSPAKVSELIIQSFDDGEGLSKAELRRLHGPDMSVRAFDTAWRMAAIARPELSKPGRKAFLSS